MRGFVSGGVSPTVVEGCDLRKELGDRRVFIRRLVFLFVEGSEGPVDSLHFREGCVGCVWLRLWMDSDSVQSCAF